MAVYKDKNGTWYVSARYDNWQGEHARKVKRGFKTKKDAMEWERDFLLEKAGSLDMTFEAFVELYKTNLKERLKQSTWQTILLQSRRMWNTCLTLFRPAPCSLTLSLLLC